MGRRTLIRGIGEVSTLLLIGLVVWMGGDLAIRGAAGFYPGYLFEAPSNLGRSGGIAPILVSTAIIVLMAVVLATILSLPTAILYTDVLSAGPLKSGLYAILDTGVGIPRIVWGLFGGVMFGGLLGLGFSVLTGVLTLVCLLSPILATGFISGLQSVDPAFYEQGHALGGSRWTILWQQVIPAARPALVATVALAVGRGCGDAAALLFTAGVATSMPHSLFDSGSTLAVFIFHLLTTVPGGQTAAYSAAAVLFGITLLIQGAIALTNRTGRFAP